MPLHPNLTSGYGVSILYTETHTFTFQIDFHTQDRCKEKNNKERKIYSGCLKNPKPNKKTQRKRLQRLFETNKTTNKRKAVYCHYEKILSYTSLGFINIFFVTIK